MAAAAADAARSRGRGCEGAPSAHRPPRAQRDAGSAENPVELPAGAGTEHRGGADRSGAPLFNGGEKGRGRFKKERRKFPWRTRSAPWVSLYHSWHHVVWSVIIYNFCPAKDAALPQEPRRAQPHSAPSLPAASGHFGSRHTHTGCAATPAAPGHNFPLGTSLQVDAEDISPRNK